MARELSEVEGNLAALSNFFSGLISRSSGMEKIHHKKAGKCAGMPKKTALTPAEQVHSDEVERVLEHVSSPYRWELLEIPATRPKTPLPKNSPEQKLGGKQ